MLAGREISEQTDYDVIVCFYEPIFIPENVPFQVPNNVLRNYVEDFVCFSTMGLEKNEPIKKKKKDILGYFNNFLLCSKLLHLGIMMSVIYRKK